MKRWALVVAALYGLILLVLSVPALVLSFWSDFRWRELEDVFASWPYWLWLAVMVAAQFALLTVPVGLASRRPITRGALWPTILAASFMMGCLALGAAFSVEEFVSKGRSMSFWIPLALAGSTWIAWALVFSRLTRTESPSDLLSRQCRLLFKGSILELLVAVPTHIIARYRDYCCAGFATFIGLTMGVAVMLFSFGPSVVVLFADRWKRLHPSPRRGKTSKVVA